MSLKENSSISFILYTPIVCLGCLPESIHSQIVVEIERLKE